MNEKEQEFVTQRQFSDFKDLLQERNDANRTAITAAFSAAKEADTKALVATEKRFEGVNEFRKAYEDIITKQMPRIESEARFFRIDEKIEVEIKNIMNRIDELMKAIATLRENQSSGMGEKTGTRYEKSQSQAWIAILIALAGLAGAFLSHIIK